MIRTLENDQLRVQINDLGAELTEIYDKTNDRQVLWNADPSYWNRHAPVLFPNVGRYYENKCLINGNTYHCGQHGFARDMEFTCTESSQTSVTHLVTSSDSTRETYPFDFRLLITHELSGRDLTVRWTVINEDSQTMYFTIGGHPAFNVPAVPGTSQDQYYLTFNHESELTCSLLDLSHGTVFEGKTYPLALEHGRCHIKRELFDNDTLVFDNGQVTRAGIAFPDGTPYVEITCKGFPNFGIWSAPDSPFVCLEPWMGRCDNTGFADELSSKQYINTLAAGETFKQFYTISVK